MASETIDLAIRDDLSAQAECSFTVLHQDALYPACHPTLLQSPAQMRTTLHGEREMDWRHWQLEGGEDVGRQAKGLNFSDPGLLLDAASEGLGVALVSQLLAQRVAQEGRLQALSEQRVRGPAWACLVHRDSQDDPLARQFLGWLRDRLQA